MASLGNSICTGSKSSRTRVKVVCIHCRKDRGREQPRSGALSDDGKFVACGTSEVRVVIG